MSNNTSASVKLMIVVTADGSRSEPMPARTAYEHAKKLAASLGQSVRVVTAAQLASLDPAKRQAETAARQAAKAEAERTYKRVLANLPRTGLDATKLAQAYETIRGTAAAKTRAAWKYGQGMSLTPEEVATIFKDAAYWQAYRKALAAASA